MKALLLLLSGTLLLLFSCQRTAKPKRTVSTAAFEKAYNLLTVNQDSAFYYFNRLVSESTDSQQVGLAYTNMAMIQSDAGDYFGAQESLISSVRFLGDSHAERRPYQAQNYNELVITAIKLKNYDEAIRYGQQALALTNNSSFRTNILNNQANAYRYQKNYGPALKLYRQAMSLTDHRGKPFARSLTNYATTQWLNHPEYDPVPELMRALQIRNRENDLWGLNSSYAHLSDYYRARQPDSALIYAKRMHEMARRLGSSDDEMEALQKLIELSPRQDLKSYFTRFTHLNDSVQATRNAAKNQFALIRYNTEKAEANSLRLEKDNAAKQYQLTKQRVILWFSAVLFVTVLTLSTYLYRKKRKEAVRENQLRMSKKVHDGVANRLYGLIQEIDHQEQWDKELMALRLNILYEISRDIAHEPENKVSMNFEVSINRLLTAFAAPGIHVAIAGNDEQCWAAVPGKVREELEMVLLEWMVNMKKHSQATQVAVRFDRLPNQLTITYTDNGIGLPSKINYGKGLRNTGNRIQQLGGSLNFDTKLTKGVRIQLILPLTQIY